MMFLLASMGTWEEERKNPAFVPGKDPPPNIFRKYPVRPKDGSELKPPINEELVKKYGKPISVHHDRVGFKNEIMNQYENDEKDDYDPNYDTKTRQLSTPTEIPPSMAVVKKSGLSFGGLCIILVFSVSFFLAVVRIMKDKVIKSTPEERVPFIFSA